MSLKSSRQKHATSLYVALLKIAKHRKSKTPSATMRLLDRKGIDMVDEITKRLEKRNADLQRVNDALERWHRKLTRAVNQIDKLRAERKRLLKPRPLEREALLKVTGEEYTKIREQDFGDTAGF